MEQTGNQHVEVVLRRSSVLLKIVVTMLILLSIGALIALRWVTGSIQSATQDMLSEAAALEEENSRLEDKTDYVDSIEGMQGVAEDVLDLADPDTVVIQPE